MIQQPADAKHSKEARKSSPTHTHSATGRGDRERVALEIVRVVAFLPKVSGHALGEALAVLEAAWPVATPAVLSELVLLSQHGLAHRLQTKHATKKAPMQLELISRPPCTRQTNSDGITGKPISSSCHHSKHGILHLGGKPGVLLVHQRQPQLLKASL